MTTEFQTLLIQAQEQQLFRPVDIQFARLIAGEHPVRFLAAASISISAGEGHVCLPLARLTADTLWSGQHQQLAEQLWQAAGAPAEPGAWQQALKGWEALCDMSGVAPLCLAADRLYLHRFWRSEQQVAAFFADPGSTPQVDRQQLRLILDQLFGTAKNNGQKVAAAVALTRQRAVISGGPGTGKTTTVAKLLAALLWVTSENIRIRMAAPTGKAAARLTESLGRALQALPVVDTLRQRFPEEATTLHRLLGAQPHTRRMRYHAGNRLHLDLLIVDEASMIDLSMMASLIDALPEEARVIFLGDRDQLASVEAGAVLGDICQCAEFGYSPERALELTELTGCQVEASAHHQAPAFRDNLCLLQHSYRFDEHSGIGQMAKAVNLGDSRIVRQVLMAGYPDIHYQALHSAQDWQQMLAAICEGYSPLLIKVKQQQTADIILQTFGDYQLLCALRDGPFGVNGLNLRIESALQQRGLISHGMSGSHWYAGRPVIITRNDSALGLFNGDIGVTLYDEQQQLKVFFQRPDGTIRQVPPSRLPAHETAWVMTVHKSQGSEFSHTALVLPRQFSPVLSRELVYTAVTRAKKQLTLFSDPDILTRAAANRTSRRSGLTEALRCRG